jgi:hypothetical protein
MLYKCSFRGLNLFSNEGNFLLHLLIDIEFFLIDFNLLIFLMQKANNIHKIFVCEESLSLKYLEIIFKDTMKLLHLS